MQTSEWFMLWSTSTTGFACFRVGARNNRWKRYQYGSVKYKAAVPLTIRSARCKARLSRLHTHSPYANTPSTPSFLGNCEALEDPTHFLRCQPKTMRKASQVDGDQQSIYFCVFPCPDEPTAGPQAILGGENLYHEESLFSKLTPHPVRVLLLLCDLPAPPINRALGYTTLCLD